MHAFSRIPNPPARLRWLALLPCLFAGSGCMLGPDYARPDTGAQLPAHFKAPDGWKIAEPADAAARGAWWKDYRDSRLDGLIEQAMADNQSLRSAFLRIEQARSLARAGRGGLLPELSFEPSGRRERRSATARDNNNGDSGAAGETTTNIDLPLVRLRPRPLPARIRPAHRRRRPSLRVA